MWHFQLIIQLFSPFKNVKINPQTKHRKTYNLPFAYQKEGCFMEHFRFAEIKYLQSIRKLVLEANNVKFSKYRNVIHMHKDGENTFLLYQTKKFRKS